MNPLKSFHGVPHFVSRCLPALGILLAMPLMASAQEDGLNVALSYSSGEADSDLSILIQILFVMTVASLGPAIVLMMTSFLRITIVLSFLRNAIGMQTTPSNQVIIGVSLFLTFFLMTPVINRIQAEAIEPYQAKTLSSQEALDASTTIMKDFMLRQTRPSDLEFFIELSGGGPTHVESLPISVVIPSFVLSELRTAFQMGFLVFLPFIVVDFVVASALMAMGMFMMPPVLVSLPFKILLFVLVDGWALVIRSLVQSFQ